jgi:UDP-glucuronate 4-epimerase
MALKNPDPILVTGGAGFIGSHLCEALLKDGHKVICYDNFNTFYDPHIKEKNISLCLKKSSFTLIRSDIRNADTLEATFRDHRPALVIHLAALPGVRPSILNPLLFSEVNIYGTQILLETMKNCGVKDLILASSSSVYGNNEKVPFSETDPADNPISPYAFTKRACELLCHNYHSLFDFNIFCFRLFTVYGPRQRPDLAINRFTNSIMAGKPIQIFGDGQTSRDYTFITDVIDGILRSIHYLGGYRIYNIGESYSISLDKMVETIENVTGKKAIKQYMPPQPGDVEKTWADISKARIDLGYNPVTGFEEGIEEFYKWKTGKRCYEKLRV